MKTTLSLLCLAVFFCTCTNEKESSKDLQYYFVNVTEDTLHISHQDPSGADSAQYIALPDSVLFKDVGRQQFSLALKALCNYCAPDAANYFAFQKIKLNNNTTGFVIFTRTEDIMTQKADLLIFDAHNKEYKLLNLAELKGSESENYQKDSWIFRINDDQVPDILYNEHYEFSRNDSIISQDTVYAMVWDKSKGTFSDFPLSDPGIFEKLEMK